MYHVSTQGADERMINVHYYYYYFVFTRMLGESYRRRFRSLLLCSCDVFPTLINSLALLNRFYLDSSNMISKLFSFFRLLSVLNQ